MRFRRVLAAALLGCYPIRASPVDTMHHSMDKKGAVASESRICTEIGIELMKRGVSIQRSKYLYAITHVNQGNAADALVGSQLCVGVIGASFKPEY